MKIIKFFSDCIVTTGVNRAVVLDIIRSKYYLVPLSMAEIITSFDGKEEQALLDAFAEQQEVLKEYMNFLDENELMFWCESEEEAASFPKLNTQWDFPARYRMLSLK